MAIKGRCLIEISTTVRDLLKNRGAIPHTTSYDYVIDNAFKRIDALELENTELKNQQKGQIDDIQTNVSKIATSLVGSINGNQ